MTEREYLMATGRTKIDAALDILRGVQLPDDDAVLAAIVQPVLERVLTGLDEVSTRLWSVELVQ